MGNVLCSQLSELLAGSSLTLITFSSSNLQLADVATNFCHILNLYIVFLASAVKVCEQLISLSRGEALVAVISGQVHCCEGWPVLNRRAGEVCSQCSSFPAPTGAPCLMAANHPHYSPPI